MVDPVSTTTGILTLIKIVVQGALQTKQFIDEIHGAPRAVQSLSKDLNALYIILGVLEGHLNTLDVQSNPAHADFVPMLSGPLENCVSAFKDITKLIKPFVKLSGDAKKSEWRRLKWTFREKEVMVLQNILSSYKTSLDIAVTVANISSSTAEFQVLKGDIKGLKKRLTIDRTSFITSNSINTQSSGSDYGYALRQFLLDTERIIGDQGPVPESSEVVEDLRSSNLQPAELTDAQSENPDCINDAHTGFRFSFESGVLDNFASSPGLKSSENRILCPGNRSLQAGEEQTNAGDDPDIGRTANMLRYAAGAKEFSLRDAGTKAGGELPFALLLQREMDLVASTSGRDATQPKKPAGIPPVQQLPSSSRGAAEDPTAALEDIAAPSHTHPFQSNERGLQDAEHKTSFDDPVTFLLEPDPSEAAKDSDEDLDDLIDDLVDGFVDDLADDSDDYETQDSDEDLVDDLDDDLGDLVDDLVDGLADDSGDYETQDSDAGGLESSFKRYTQYVRVLYTRLAKGPYEMSMVEGEILLVLNTSETGWLDAITFHGERGWIPGNHVVAAVGVPWDTTAPVWGLFTRPVTRNRFGSV